MTSAKKLSPVQIDVIENDEGRTLREELTPDNNRYVPVEFPCKFGLNCHQSSKTPYRLKADPHSQVSCADLPFHPPPPAFSAACKVAGEQHPDRSLIMSWMQPTPLPAQNVIRACFRLLLSLKPGCGKELLACMAGLRFLVRLDQHDGGDRRRPFDCPPAGQEQQREKHHGQPVPLVPQAPSLAPDASDDLDKVPTCRAGRFTLLADSVGRLVASSRVGALLFVPIAPRNTLLPNCARAPPC